MHEAKNIHFVINKKNEMAEGKVPSATVHSWFQSFTNFPFRTVENN